MIGAGRPWRALGWAAACLALGILLSLALGAGEVDPRRALAALAGAGDDEARFVVAELRLPRTAIGVLVGAALGVAGALLQAAARNPLAEPGLLGVSAGASFAVVLALAAGASLATLQLGTALLGAMAGCGLALAAARLRGVGDDPVRLVLAGTALSSLLAAASAVLLLFNQRAADEIRFWTVGGLAGRSLASALSALPAIGLGLALAALLARPLAALALGDEVASSLGHRPQRVRAGVLLAVALLVGSATAAAGPIAFVGLVVPHAARALAGPDVRRALGVCALLGPAMVLLADVLSRLLVRPAELPLGVITALLGAPVLVAVVRRQRMPML